jgi:hypothetical protein
MRHTSSLTVVSPAGHRVRFAHVDRQDRDSAEDLTGDRRSDLQRRRFLPGDALADTRPGVEMSSIRPLRQDPGPASRDQSPCVDETRVRHWRTGLSTAAELEAAEREITHAALIVLRENVAAAPAGLLRLALLPVKRPRSTRPPMTPAAR